MAKSFVEILSEMDRGDIVDDITKHLSTVSAAVIATDKKGTITLIIEIQPNGENAVQLSAKVKSTIPDPTRGSTVMFLQSDGVSLGRDDPRQGRLELARPGLREVRKD